MTKRAEAVEATRERIVEATVSAHRDLGIQATSWDEIARRAGVGVGTVYRHFRSLDELLPACGAIVDQTLALPSEADIRALFGNAPSRRARAERLVGEAFGIYERAAPFIENIRRERNELPILGPWHHRIEATLEALTREALRPAAPNKRRNGITRALIDLSTWRAFKDRGFAAEDAVDAVAGLIHCLLGSGRRSGQIRPTPGRHPATDAAQPGPTEDDGDA